MFVKIKIIGQSPQKKNYVTLQKWHFTDLLIYFTFIHLVDRQAAVMLHTWCKSDTIFHVHQFNTDINNNGKEENQLHATITFVYW
jgi:hypothetical protein